MIVGERKPLQEITDRLQGFRKVLILGCGTCVSVCMAGGEKEVGILASTLRLSDREKGRTREVLEATIERQCDREFFEPIREQIPQRGQVRGVRRRVGNHLVRERSQRPVGALQLLAEPNPEEPLEQRAQSE